MNDDLIIARHGPVAWLTVNRPEVRNALSLEITQRIAETLRELSRDRTLRVFVLTGAGDRVFVSGADVREFREQLATPESALLYDAAADNCGLFCGNAGAQPAGQRADLRFVATASYSNGRCTSRK